MYTRWRPVPSARTVKILYQLGYICSGTAVGLATLCLEEQRRRIQILQRVADNAKVIRQHPRYRGSLALALENTEECEPGVIATPNAQENLVKRRGRRRERSSEHDLDAIEDPHLPSVVDREYYKLVEGRRIEGEAHRVSGLPTNKTSTPRLRKHSTSKNPVRRIESDIKHTLFKRPTLPISPDTDRDRIHVRREPPTEADYLDASLELSRDPSHEDCTSATLDRHTSPNDVETQSKQDRTTFDLTTERISPENLGHDVKHYLSESRHFTQNLASSRLFRSAVDSGSLEDVRAMWLWKLSHDCFTDADAEYLYGSCGTLGTKHDRTKLSEFFESIFRSSLLSKLKVREQLQLAFNTIGRYFDGMARAKRLGVHDAVQSICARDRFGGLVPEVLDQVCKTLTAEGETRAAVSLFIWIANARTPYFVAEKQLALADELYDAVCAKGVPSHCASLLRWKAHRVSYEALLPQIDSLVQLCGEKHANRLLLNVFGKASGIKNLKRSKRLLKDLSPKSRVILAVALSVEHKHSEELYRSLPRELRSLVNESVINSLKYLWRSTHDFEGAHLKIEQFSRRLRYVNDRNAVAELDEVALEIYVSASRMDLALETLRRMQDESRTSDLAISQTALTFAKQGSWQSFSRMLNIMKNWSSFQFDDDTTRVFNIALYVYCQCHSAEEILELTTHVIKELAFKPNFATSDIVLGAFVLKQRFDLISRWAECLSTWKYKWVVRPNMAASLLRRFYIEHRPSHVFTILLCRRLALVSPSFACEDLKQLVEQAISYDLRHLSGQNAPWQQVHAEKRLERLHATKSIIPSPGFAWNEQLYFHDSQEDIFGLETQSTPVYRPLEVSDTVSVENNEQDIDLAEDADEFILDNQVDFEDLRSSQDGEQPLGNLSQREYEFSTRGRKQLEGHMWSHMSTGDHDKVLQLYRESRDEAGLPASPVVLELAIEASLRRDQGDESNARSILADAREAGMNTTCATGPFIVHQLKYLDLNSFANGLAIRRAVVEYYQSNDENGWRVNNHLGTCAADVLIQRRQARHGLTLLSEIYTSKWAKKRPLDIVALTVFLKGYIRLQSVEGVRWVVDTVLEHDIRITKRFVKQLRFLTRGDYKWMNEHPAEFRPLFSSWVQSCEQRHREQKEATHKLGWELVEQIAKCSNDTSRVRGPPVLKIPHKNLAVDHARDEEDQYKDFIDESYYSDESTEESAESDPEDEIRRRIIEDWNAEQRFRKRLKKAALAQGTRDKRSELIFPDTDHSSVDGIWDFEFGVEDSTVRARDQRADAQGTDNIDNTDSSSGVGDAIVEESDFRPVL